jgi:tripartite-type tricarboxylate transporter receptor subunit TctC
MMVIQIFKFLKTKTIQRISLLVGIFLMCNSVAFAQTDWPKAKNVTIYVAFAPGAFTDVIARIVGQRAS